MILKNLMEDKQLDFYQPLLSVRRSSTTGATSKDDNKRKIEKSVPQLPPLPVYKSELKSGPVRNPGKVPFVWEKTPGNPKDERKSQTKVPERPPSVPKLPPGRVSNKKQQASDKLSKSTSVPQSLSASILSSSRDASDLDKRSEIKDKRSRQGKEENCSSGSEDGEEAYVDALDTLSRSESFFMNCSVTGVSGYDDPDVRPSGTVSTDPHTRDFMMDRFLPAAKAMASDTPQYAPRRKQVVWEQPRQVNKVVNSDRQPPHNQCRPNVLLPYAQDIGEEESEDESESDSCESTDILSAKLCGLFPRFCIKSSLCLLNPVPGVKMQAQFPVSSVRRVRAKSSYASSCSGTSTEQVEDVVSEQILTPPLQTSNGNKGKIGLKCKSNEVVEKSESPKLDRSSLYRHLQDDNSSLDHNKHSLSTFLEQNGLLDSPGKAKNSRNSGFDIHKSARTNFRKLANENNIWEVGFGSPVVEKTLYIDAVHTVKSTSSNSSSLDMKDLTDCRGNDVEIPEKSNDMEDNPSLDSSLKDIRHSNVVNQKETARPKSLESVDSHFRSTFDKKIDMKNGSNQIDLIQDSISLFCSKVTDQENFDSQSPRSGKPCYQEKCLSLVKDSVMFNSSNEANNKIDFKIQEHFRLNDQNDFHGHFQNPITMTRSEKAHGRKFNSERQWLMKSGTKEDSLALVPSSTSKASKTEVIDLEIQRLVNVGNQESSNGSSLQMSLALPLPKSPSESWLKRTLPTISSKNSYSLSSLDAHICSSSPKRSYLDPKWETIVKTTNLQHGHLRFSQENLFPIPEA
ncbi:uncharacterized protein LOC133817374 [Humulus lupulus]|uniref:uncharacterized protein LOC133817374 n=1 Tax=Humulus lupulus TaxID=3486 RepID=UPI002B4100E7|nr:uncharacterized protein LOC133817374 [Humulus lupulus]XP_062105861.1 uncharacterized protein LOC133817374 [Humulus lupulus]